MSANRGLSTKTATLTNFEFQVVIYAPPAEVVAFGKVGVPRFLSLGPANEAANISLGQITLLSSFVARNVVLYPILTKKTSLIKLGLKNENQPKKNVEIALTIDSGTFLFVFPSVLNLKSTEKQYIWLKKK